MPSYTFGSPTPAKLYVELRSGRLELTATETDATTITVTGKGAEDVVVEQDGDQISVLDRKPRVSFFGGEAITVEATVPLDSQLRTKTGSADVRAQGRLAAAWLQTGSGDVDLDEIAGPLDLGTGSGDVEVRQVSGPARFKTGSGEVTVGTAQDVTSVSSGSGDVAIKYAGGAVRVKSGSGDVRVEVAESDVSLATGSGDLAIGRVARGNVESKGASGDIRVGIPAGTPVWTDITTVTGSIRSSLESAGQPVPGQDHVELRARTVSGDIILEQL